MSNIYTYLHALRLGKGLSDKDMCNLLFVSPRSLQAIESGAALPPAEMLITYANALGMNVEELLIHFLNEHAKDFCRRVGIGKKLTFKYEEDLCGAALGVEAQSRYAQRKAKLSQLLVEKTTTG